jgi:hypothetical protein
LQEEQAEKGLAAVKHFLDAQLLAIKP